MENNLTSLLGRWESINLNSGEKISMEFKDNGELVYTIHLPEKDQIMNLVFRVEGKTIVSNQPSHPREEITQFIFEGDKQLILERDGEETRFFKV